MRVGVVAKLIKSEYNEILEALDIRFCQKLLGFGIRGEILNYQSVSLEGLDGVIISGGNDLAYIINSDINELRDSFEGAVLNECERLGLPVLGICKGAQSLAFRAGATIKPCQNHTKSHMIEWSNGERGEVNSYHNYAICDDFGAEILARSSDGFVEVFLHGRSLGAMWHFERESEPSKASKKIFEIFKELK